MVVGADEPAQGDRGAVRSAILVLAELPFIGFDDLDFDVSAGGRVLADRSVTGRGRSPPAPRRGATGRRSPQAPGAPLRMAFAYRPDVP